MKPFLPGVGFPPLPNTAGNPKTYLAGGRGWREEPRPFWSGDRAVGADRCPHPLFAGVYVWMSVWETLPLCVRHARARAGIDRRRCAVFAKVEEGKRKGTPRLRPPTREFE